MSAPGGLVVVTGGASGIGAAAVQAAAEIGLAPVVLDISPPGTPGPHALVWATRVDISDAQVIATEIAAIEDRLGPIEGLVNAAGILGKMHTPERVRLDNWDREMAVDLRGTFLMCREVGTRMAERGRGVIVNVASISGMTSAPAHAYAVAKAGVIHLTTTLAAEWGRAGVRVNAVSPGFTRTPALEAGLASGALNLERLTADSAMGRLVEPMEVGRAIAWLLSEHSSGITGANIPVDAGFLVGIPWRAYGGFRSGRDK
jgi:NAD(P)-dependent dehydrogenase (short-subunit alcohol dehydrogenase family)